MASGAPHRFQYVSSSSRQESWIVKGDQNRHFSPSWSFPTGDGLERASLGPWKARLTKLVLISRLVEEEAFWGHVDQVRGGEDPRDVAKDYAYYAYAKRRESMADLLIQAASEMSRDELEWGAAATGEQRRTRVRARLEISHWTVGDEPPGRGQGGEPAPYAFRPEFRQKVLEGADLIARLGAGKCLAREGPRWCSQTQQPSVGRDAREFDGWYCRRHSSRDEYEHGRRYKRMALVLEHVAASMR